MDETKGAKRYDEVPEQNGTGEPETETIRPADQAETNASEQASDKPTPSVAQDHEQAEHAVQTEAPKEKAKSSKKKFIVAGVLAVLVVAGAVFGIVYANKRKAEEISKRYKGNLTFISSVILSSSTRAEKCGNLIRNVWYNSIWKVNDPTTNPFTASNGRFHDDFNDSLAALFTDLDFMKEQNSLKFEQGEVERVMKELKDPPEEWEDAYEDLKDCYDDYMALSNLVLSPSGSLNTFTTAFSEADRALLNSYKKVIRHLDE